MKRHGFTLIELLIVIAVLGVLMALLITAGQGAFGSMKQTACAGHLGTMWQAISVWRHDNPTRGAFPRGASWQQELLPYVEDRETVFTCPGRGGSASDAGMASITASAHVKFVIQENPDARDQSRYYTKAYPLEIPLDEANLFVTKVDKGEYIEYFVDDGEHKQGQGKHGDDIHFKLYYEGGMPVRMETFPGKSSSRNKYFYELWVGDRMITDDYFNEYAKVGKDVELPLAGSLCDYGMSKGTYETLSGKVEAVDPGLFLILDYAMPVADYNNEVGDNDQWGMYFVRRDMTDQWAAQYDYMIDVDAQDEITWETFQALRHDWRANVLFCDGSVKALPPEELEEDQDPQTTRWFYVPSR